MSVPLYQSSSGGGTTVNTKAKVTSLWLDSFTSATGLFTASQPAFTDISGSVAASQLPNPSATTLGGIQSIAAVSHKWINTISTSGVPALTQPDYSDLTGTPGATLAAILSCFGAAIYTPTTVSTSAAGPSTVANNVHVFQFVLTHSITINKITYAVTTLSASDKWAFGIYSSDGNTKLVDSGVISPTATNTALSVTITPVTLSPGVYYFAQTSSGTTALTNFQQINDTQLSPLRNLNRPRIGTATNASAAGVLPATLGVVNSTVRSPMIVLFEN